MISLLKNVIKLGAIPNMSDINEVSSEEYEQLRKQIAEENWRFSSKKTFDIYEKNILKIIKYQNDNLPKGSQDMLLNTMGNYLYVKANTAVELNHLFASPTHSNDLYILAIISYLNSILYAEENNKTSYIPKKIEQLKNCLRSYLHFRYKLIKYEYEITTTEIIKFIKEAYESFDIKIFNKYISDAELNSLSKNDYEINKCNLYYLRSERLKYVEESFGKYKTSIIWPIGLLESTILNPNKHKILERDFKTKEEVESTIKEDLNILELYKDKLKKYSYEYLKIRILINEVTYLAKFLNNIKKITKSKELLESIDKAMGYKNIKLDEKKHLEVQKIFFLMNLHFQQFRFYLEQNKFIDSVHFIENKVKKSDWYKNKEYIAQSEDNEKIKTIFDLSLLFFDPYIKKEQYEYLDKIKDSCLKLKVTRNLYDLVYGKLCLKCTGISTPKKDIYFEDLLNSKLKEIVLNEEQPIVDYSELKKLEREKIFEFYKYISNEEGLELEFKSNFTVDINKYLMEHVIEGTKDFYGQYLETIAQFLNTNGGVIIVGIWENERYKKIEEKVIVKDFVIFDKTLKNFCITGIELDLQFKNINFDQLKLKIEQAIKKYIDPNPVLKGDHIQISKTTILNRNLCIIRVPKGKQYYNFIKEIEGKNGEIHKIPTFYLRGNHGKIELTMVEKDEYIKKNPR
jgi:hypothetical protein